MRRTLIAADEVVVVATPDLASLRNAKNMIDLVRQGRPNDAPPRLVLNQVGVPGRPEIPAKDFGEALGVHPSLIIPFEPKLFGAAANNGQMILEAAARSKAAEALPDPGPDRVAPRDRGPAVRQKTGRQVAVRQAVQALGRQRAACVRQAHSIGRPDPGAFAPGAARARAVGGRGLRAWRRPRPDTRPGPHGPALCLAASGRRPTGPAGGAGPQTPGGPRGGAPGGAPRPAGSGPRATAGFEQLKKAQAVAEIVREQSDYYHATKTTIFNALMNTIDLAQLAQLDTKAASEEIRDIVAELVAIKNVSMSVAEQEHLVQDIVNDVLGYGPLEPLLARDDIADIMVNGAEPGVHRGRRQGPADQRPLPRQRPADEHLPADRVARSAAAWTKARPSATPACRTVRASTSSPRRWPSTARP